MAGVGAAAAGAASAMASSPGPAVAVARPNPVRAGGAAAVPAWLARPTSRLRLSLGTLALKPLGMRTCATSRPGPLRSCRFRPPQFPVQGQDGGARFAGVAVRASARRRSPGAPGRGTTRHRPARRLAMESTTSDCGAAWTLTRRRRILGSESSRRSLAYSLKSPRWQVMAFHSRPGTPRGSAPAWPGPPRNGRPGTGQRRIRECRGCGPGQTGPQG